ncbi:MAG: serine/threonine protein kinase [Planctomycetes bacterium]|nr:serine/threonine protein kinase [Planctomycetota bacterium]
MAEHIPFEKLFATKVVHLGLLSREEVLDLYRRRRAQFPAGNAPPLDAWLVEAGAIAAEAAERIRRAISATSQTLAAPDTHATLAASGKPPAHPLLGKNLGGYQIESRIGGGGMGELFKALDPALDKHFAVKVISSDRARNPEYLARLQGEARLASRIDDPHTVPILKFGEDQGYHFCVMPYVEGKNLHDHIRQKGPLAMKEALAILGQAARGLAAIHRAGIIHRDVKPENLLINREGRVLVADFGLAKDLRVDSSLTATGQVLGTPHYMSPEQAGGGEIDARTDVYSLGLTFYFLLTGSPPFDGATAIAVIDKQRHEPLPDPGGANPEATGEPVKLLYRMTAKDPEMRPRSMEEVQREIEILAAGGRIRGPGRVARALRARAGAVAAVGLLAVLALAGTGAWAAGLFDPAPEENPGPDVEPAGPEQRGGAPTADESQVWFQQAEEFRAKNSGHPELAATILERYQRILDRFPDTLAAGASEDRIVEILDGRRQALAGTLLPLAREGRVGEAIARLEQARGEFASPHWDPMLDSLRLDLYREAVNEVDHLLGSDDPGTLLSARTRVQALLDQDLRFLSGAGPGLSESDLEHRLEVADRKLAEVKVRLGSLLARARALVKGGEPAGLAEARVLLAPLRGHASELAFIEKEFEIDRPAFEAWIEGIDRELDTARDKAVDRVFALVLIGDSAAAAEYVGKNESWLRPPGVREGEIVREFQELADKVARTRHKMWRGVLLADPDGVREAWRSAPGLPDFLGKEYPKEEEKAPVKALEEALEAVLARLEEAAATRRSIYFRARGEEARVQRIVLSLDRTAEPLEATLAYRKFQGNETEKLPVRKIHPDDFVALALGGALDTNKDPEVVDAASAAQAALLYLGLGVPDAAEGLAKEKVEDEHQRSRILHAAEVVRLELASIAAGGNGPGPDPRERPGRESELVRRLQDQFGPQTRLLEEAEDRLRVSVSYDFETLAERGYFDKKYPGYRTDVSGGRLRVIAERNDAGDDAQGFIALLDDWEEEIEAEMRFDFPGERNRFVGIVYFLQDSGMAYVAGARWLVPDVAEKTAGLFLARTSPNAGPPKPTEIFGRAPGLRLGARAGEEMGLRLSVRGSRHEVRFSRPGAPDVVASGDDPELRRGRVAVGWTRIEELRIDRLAVEGWLTPESSAKFLK